MTEPAGSVGSRGSGSGVVEDEPSWFRPEEVERRGADGPRGAHPTSEEHPEPAVPVGRRAAPEEVPAPNRRSEPGWGPDRWSAPGAVPAQTPPPVATPADERLVDERPADGVPELLPDTAMQKVVLPGLVDLLLGNVVVPGLFDPHRASGYASRLEDVPGGTATELTARYGLDQVPGWPVGGDLHLLRFYAHSPRLFTTPFTRNVYQMDVVELPAGTELWRIDGTGAEQRVAAYLHRQIGWVGTAPVPLGPGRWRVAPVPLRPTVRRGLVAGYRGGSFDADFGPRPGEVTLHPMPGRPAPEGFETQAGTSSLVVPIDQLDGLELVRWHGRWHGLDVQLVESAAGTAVVHYCGDDAQRAAEVGLAEVDYRVWRGPVPAREVLDVRRDVLRL